MGSGLFRLSKGRRWLRGHVRVVVTPGARTTVVTPRGPAPEITLSVRRRPAPSRVTITEAPS
jgi:hypothetical protein